MDYDSDCSDFNGNVKPDRIPDSSIKKRKKEEKNKVSSRGELVNNDEIVYTPMHHCAVWTNEAMTKCCTVAIALVGGVACDTSDACALKIEDDGWTLVLTLKWPGLMEDMDKLHAGFDSNEKKTADFNTQKMALKMEVAKKKELATNTLVSVARIPLTIQVQERIMSMECFGDKLGTRILYVKMKAPESSYTGVGVKKFKMI